MVIQLDDTPGVMAELSRTRWRQVSGEYPDHSPEYSDQRGGNTDAQCGGAADNEECWREMVEEIEQHSGVHYLKIVGRE